MWLKDLVFNVAYLKILKKKPQLIKQEIIEIMINGQYRLAGFAFVTKAEVVKVLLKSHM